MPESKRTERSRIIDGFFKPDKNGVSRWKSRSMIQKNRRLKFTDNGNSRHGIFFGDSRYIWETKRERPGGKVTHIRMAGFNSHSNTPINRGIRKDIRTYYKNQPCVACGQKGSCEADHKNDLYNDPRVISIKTQDYEDFQSLCPHCNTQKRQISKEERKDNRLYSAKNIPKYSIYPFEFPWEKKNYDIQDKLCKVDTYWYDVMEFENKIYQYVTYKLPIVNELKKIFN